MRKIIFIIGLVLFGICGYSQTLKQEDVPQKVLDCFHFEFPQSVDLPVAWTKDGGNFKAQLTIMDEPAIMVLDSLGKTKRIERTIHPKYLPSKATAYMKKLDPNFEAIKAIRIVDEKGTETFKLTAKIRTDYTFDGSGKVVGTK